MNELGFSISNHQDWRFYVSLNGSDLQVNSLINNKKPEKGDILCKVGFVWSQKHSENLTTEQKLQIELMQAHYNKTKTEASPFAVCKRKEGEIKHRYIVFGYKTDQRIEGLISSGILSGIGLGLIAAGTAPFVGAVILGGFSSMFFDTYKKDELVFNSDDVVKQGLIGAAVSVFTGGVGAFFNAGKSAQFATQILSNSATNTAGYVASEMLNGRDIKVAGVATSALTGMIGAAAGKAAAGMIAGQVADKADDILLKAFTEGTISSGTKQLLNNRMNSKPLSEDLASSALFGGVYAFASAIPEAAQTIHEADSAIHKLVKTDKTQQDILSSTKEDPEKKIINLSDQPFELISIKEFIEDRSKVFINNQWEKYEKNADTNWHTQQVLENLAQGKKVIFKNDGRKYIEGRKYIYTSNSSPEYISKLLKDHYEFWASEPRKIVHRGSPKNLIKGDTKQIIERLAKGESIDFIKDNTKITILPLKLNEIRPRQNLERKAPTPQVSNPIAPKIEKKESIGVEKRSTPLSIFPLKPTEAATPENLHSKTATPKFRKPTISILPQIERVESVASDLDVSINLLHVNPKLSENGIHNEDEREPVTKPVDADCFPHLDLNNLDQEDVREIPSAKMPQAKKQIQHDAQIKSALFLKANEEKKKIEYRMKKASEDLHSIIHKLENCRSSIKKQQMSNDKLVLETKLGQLNLILIKVNNLIENNKPL